jgi:hypothetical protein
MRIRVARSPKYTVKELGRRGPYHGRSPDVCELMFSGDQRRPQRSCRRPMAKKKRAAPTLPVPAVRTAWRIHFFKRHADDDPRQPVPARDFLDR